MLLAVNVGNSNIVLGLYEGERLAAYWRLHTEPHRTVDEYAVLLSGLLARKGIASGEIGAMVLASVVPALTPVCVALGRDYLGCDPLVVGPDLVLGVRLGYTDPAQLGADRIANAAGAYYKYGGPVIVVDLGTATTVDAIDASGLFLGGAIAPGIGIASEALFSRAARLFRVDLVPPAAAIGRSTADCLRSGIVFGFAGQVDALVGRIAAELGGRPGVVATGGLAHLVRPVCASVQVVDPFLTLEGLRVIHALNAARLPTA